MSRLHPRVLGVDPSAVVITHRVAPNDRSGNGTVTGTVTPLGAVVLDPLPDDDTWVARTCLAITAVCTEGRATPPLLLVLEGERARHAPALGFAQRAARRSVCGYVLIDPTLPAPGSDWPDAPVTVVLTQASDQTERDARLRGWEVVTGEPNAVIADLVGHL